jgi:hypothetical protein
MLYQAIFNTITQSMRSSYQGQTTRSNKDAPPTAVSAGVARYTRRVSGGERHR